MSSASACDRAGQPAVGEHRRVDAADDRRAGRRVRAPWSWRGPRSTSCRAASGSRVEQLVGHARGSSPSATSRAWAPSCRSRSIRRSSAAEWSTRLGAGLGERLRPAARAARCARRLSNHRSIADRARMSGPIAEPPEGRRSRPARSSSTHEQRRARSRRCSATQQPGQVAPGHRVAWPSRRAAGHEPPRRRGRYGGGSGVPSTRPPSRRCRLASHRVAGTRHAAGAGGRPRSRRARRRRRTRTNSTSAGTASSSCAAAYAVSRSRLGGRSGVVLTGSSCPIAAVADSGARHHPGPGPGAPDPTAPRSRGWSDPENHDPRGDVMSPNRTAWPSPDPQAARWSATHPWRAIARLARASSRSPSGWPSPVPTDGDHRRRLPARRVRPRRRDGRRGRPRRARRRERPDHRRAATGRSTRPRPTAAAAELRRRRCAPSTASTQVAEPQWNPDRSALLIVGPARAATRTTPAPLAGRHRRASQADHPDLRGPRGR